MRNGILSQMSSSTIISLNGWVVPPEKTNTAVRVTSAPTDEISTLVQMVACIDCNNGRKLMSECSTIS